MSQTARKVRKPKKRASTYTLSPRQKRHRAPFLRSLRPALRPAMLECIKAFEQRLDRMYGGWVHQLAQEFAGPGQDVRAVEQAVLDRDRRRERRRPTPRARGAGS